MSRALALTEAKLAKVKKYLARTKQRDEEEVDPHVHEFLNVDIMDSIPKRENQDTIPLTVHIAPTTHTDLGWDNTVDELFTDAINGLQQHTSVDLIITNVINELGKDPRRKFTYTEMKFFSMWYAK